MRHHVHQVAFAASEEVIRAFDDGGRGGLQRKVLFDRLHEGRFRRKVVIRSNNEEARQRRSGGGLRQMVVVVEHQKPVLDGERGCDGHNTHTCRDVSTGTGCD